jgi:hypothetical protein
MFKETYVLHELFANRSNFFAQCGTEHHDLFVVWRHFEYFLYIGSHVFKIVKFICKE